MLVLSRKETDKIVFPTLGITVEVLRIRGNVARIGVEAPSEVPIYRHELTDRKHLEFSTDQDSSASLRQLVHAVRHRLDTAAEALNRLHEQYEYDRNGHAQHMVLDVFRELRLLEKEAAEAIGASEERAPRALLIEDNANERELLAGFLRSYGIETTTAQDGQDALDYLSLHALPDVVLLDMQMPRCNGRCFIKKVRASTDLRDLKVYAVSGIDPTQLRYLRRARRDRPLVFQASESRAFGPRNCRTHRLDGHGGLTQRAPSGGWQAEQSRSRGVVRSLDLAHRRRDHERNCFCRHRQADRHRSGWHVDHR
jgi:carbon storage regulator CsrA